MAIYDRQINTAKRLIAKYGVSVPVTNKRIVPVPGEPWHTTEVIETNTVKICFLTLDSGTLKTLSLMPNTEVPKGAVLALMGAVTFDVNLTTTVVHEGKTWAIYNMDKLAPNGRPILYTMVLGS
jgi:hypothetical protein